ncbi:hypothetical protein BVG16_21450 [Paenibacillus selenitireducens]|uniref:DUF5626 domain-containing protein n=1 Tax=Paenibacillus selenitireducens TaxID=1324314 RepID=A0A1T2X5M5_9BACL|nr:hypothetical protein [Paenibacillus selenitireducens]OPA75174.1 hypothetical protein BVG16_21450 [Paenibacillus selenitireducens]
MKSFKKIAHIILLAVLIVALPTSVFAEVSQVPSENVEAGTYPEHVRIPIKLVPLEGNQLAKGSGTIDGYLDFWSEVDGKTVDANWTVTITTPKTWISYVNMVVTWDIEPYGEQFKYSTFGTPRSVSNQATKSYAFAGKKFATINGSVTCLSSDGSGGVAYAVTPGTIQFEVK